MTWVDGGWVARLHEPNFALPDGLTPTTATFGDDVPFFALPGYRLEQDGGALRLTLIWQAVYAPGDYIRFVHLLDAAGNIVAQADGAPAGDSYPTGQWQPGVSARGKKNSTTRRPRRSDRRRASQSAVHCPAGQSVLGWKP